MATWGRGYNYIKIKMHLAIWDENYEICVRVFILYWQLFVIIINYNNQ